MHQQNTVKTRRRPSGLIAAIGSAGVGTMILGMDSLLAVPSILVIVAPRLWLLGLILALGIAVAAAREDADGFWNVIFRTLRSIGRWIWEFLP